MPTADSTNLSEPSYSSLQLKLKHPITSNNLRPPQKPLSFIEYDSSKARKWRNENIQAPFWLKDTTQVTVKSEYKEAADTCQRYQKCLSTATMRVESISTLSEWCLMREIIWMLQLEPEFGTKPNKLEKTSKFFSINCDKAEIVVNSKVSLASVTIDGIQSILHDFASTMTILYRFRQFFQNIFHTEEGTSNAIPHSLECYANGLIDFLRILSDAINRIEGRLIEQDPMEIETVVQLYNELMPHFRMVKELHDIHTKVYIDFKENAGKPILILNKCF